MNRPSTTRIVGHESYWAAARGDFPLGWIFVVIWLFLVTGLRGSYTAAMFVFFSL